MKRLFITAALVTMLAACGGSEEPTPAPTPASSPETSAPAPVATPTPTAAPEVDPVLEAAMAALPEPYNAADYKRGENIFRQCASCHRLDASGGHRVGPNLHGMFGRVVGTAEGFDYSDAVEEAGFEWTAVQLEEWLASPREFLPGNRMSFAGVRRERDRHDLIAFLMIRTEAEEPTE